MGVGAFLGIVSEGLKGAVYWILGYTKPDTTRARRINDAKEKKDAFNEALAANDIDTIRKKLNP